jgi:hypothetical protein
MRALSMTSFTSRATLLVLLAGFASGAAAQQVYQWKDAKGVTHYSDKLPAGEKYQDRRFVQRGAAVVEAGASEPAENPTCITARDNLKLLGGGSVVQQDTDGDGKPDKTLSDTERDNQRNLAEAAVRAYCKPAPAAEA